MNTIKSILIGIILFILSQIILLLLGIEKLYFVFFIPVFVSSSPLSIIPFLLLFIPIFISFFEGQISVEKNEFQGFLQNDINYTKSKEVNYGGILLIGPIPIIFGKGVSRKVLIILILIMIAITISLIVFSR